MHIHKIEIDLFVSLRKKINTHLLENIFLNEAMPSCYISYVKLVERSFVVITISVLQEADR